MKVAPYVVALSVALAGCAREEPKLASPPPPATPRGSVKFKSPTAHFSIVLPKNIHPLDPDSKAVKEMMQAAATHNPQLRDQIQRIMNGGTYSLYAMDLKQATAKAPFVDNVNVIHRKDSPAPPMTGETIEKLRVAITSKLPGAKVLEGEVVTLPIGQAIRVVSELPLTNAAGEPIVARSEGYYLGDQDRFYVVTFTSGGTSRSSEFRKSMETFRVE